jgi:hypothetical protein
MLTSCLLPSFARRLLRAERDGSERFQLPASIRLSVAKLLGRDWDDTRLGLPAAFSSAQY